jgi:hypothetical protein
MNRNQARIDERRRARIAKMRTALALAEAEFTEAMLSRYRDIRTVDVITRDKRGLPVHEFKVTIT